MSSHELDIVIGKDGQVRVHIQGVKGHACLTYAQLLEQIVGKEISREFTAEYYEPDSGVRVIPQQRVKGEG